MEVVLPFWCHKMMGMKDVSYVSLMIHFEKPTVAIGIV